MTDGQTDRKTEGQTDGQNYDSQERASIAASRGKNRLKFDTNLVAYFFGMEG